MEDRNEIEATLKMLADYMEGGFLENIVDMFKRNMSYFPYISKLLGDERMGVRIGTVALVEALIEEGLDDISSAVPGIAGLLNDPNVTIRGDAAYLLGIIGHRDALPFLRKAADDEHYMVREAVRDAIEEINSRKD